jgi:hypothetical protein
MYEAQFPKNKWRYLKNFDSLLANDFRFKIFLCLFGPSQIGVTKGLLSAMM